MKQSIPPIKAVMTSFPFWIASHVTLIQAQQVMSEKGIHHLPVKEEGELIGVITRKYLDSALSTENMEHNKNTVVGDVCIKDLYIVDLEEPLDNVLLHMASFHIGSVLVTKNARLAGLFTMNDACRSFGEYLRKKFRPGGSDDAA